MYNRYEATQEQVDRIKSEGFNVGRNYYMLMNNDKIVYSIDELIDYNLITEIAINEYVINCTFHLVPRNSYKYKERLLSEYHKYFRRKKILNILL